MNPQMLTGTTGSGFEYAVNPKLKDDFRFAVAFAKLTGGEPQEQLTAGAELVRLVLGKEGAERLYRHVAEEDGTVPTARVMAELGEIVAAAGRKDLEVKN